MNWLLGVVAVLVIVGVGIIVLGLHITGKEDIDG